MSKRSSKRLQHGCLFRLKMITKKQIFGVFVVCAIVAVISYINFYSNYGSRRETPNDDIAPINVVILAYPRTGSSLLGELLSSIHNCTYFFEPLAYYCSELNKCDEKALYIDRLLSCEGNVIKDLSEYKKVKLVRKVNGFDTFDQMSSAQFSRNCKIDRFHVVKTTRLRMSDIINIIRHKKIPNLRVVHLIRDPRARFFSMSQKTEFKNVTVDEMCDEMISDIHLVQSISKTIYSRIRYEDLVADPRQRVKSLFERLYHQNYGNQTSQYITTHMGNGSWKPTHDEFIKYYSTHRVTGINIDRWQDLLSKEKIQQIETSCQFVLSEMDYPLLNPIQTDI